MRSLGSVCGQAVYLYIAYVGITLFISLGEGIIKFASSMQQRAYATGQALLSRNGQNIIQDSPDDTESMTHDSR